VREREIYSHKAGNQKGFHPSKLAPITKNIIMHRLDITQNIQKKQQNYNTNKGKGRHRKEREKQRVLCELKSPLKS